jgi:hypothetical protein
VSERRDVCHPRAATQTEWLGHGNGLDDREFCVVLSTQSQCAPECRPGGSGEINRTKNARELNHEWCSVLMKAGERRRPEGSDRRPRLRSLCLATSISSKADRQLGPLHCPPRPPDSYRGKLKTTFALLQIRWNCLRSKDF